MIKSLRTVGQDLRIEAELNLELQSARDISSIVKHSGGLSFSVGFTLEEYDLADEKTYKRGDPYLIIKRGDLIEVSIVTFPARAEATMDAKARTTSPAFARVGAEIERLRVTLAGPHASAALSELQSRQAAIMSKVVELKQALRKRQRDEETLREYRYWRDEQAHSLRGKMNPVGGRQWLIVRRSRPVCS